MSLDSWIKNQKIWVLLIFIFCLQLLALKVYFLYNLQIDHFIFYHRHAMEIKFNVYKSLKKI